ncbi:MAG: hypothetical protein KatS3mg100_102 [Candidatus Parcubacteria bacterium]|nr:MAG: hypothetical protein KatS3mg100_102 [Candidatus Parcubacteria bacterium]
MPRRTFLSYPKRHSPKAPPKKSELFVGVVGYGYVGKAVARFFAERFVVAVYDPYVRKLPPDTPQGVRKVASLKALKEALVSVVCVPTPQREDGAAEVSIVEEVVRTLPTDLIVIKSTVPPGTTQRLREETGKRIVFSPEYIGEGKYPVFSEGERAYPHPTDMRQHRFHIFGGPREDTRRAAEIWQKVAGPQVRYLQTDSTTAELVKYAENSYLALKVTFCNQLYDLAQALGVDYHELRELWLEDGRVEPSHTLVYPDSRGFGGKCLPKDTAAILAVARKVGVDFSVMKAAVDYNRWLRKTLED